ncbi:hypothetical protein [[Flexibacter] sp. ATCC 35103]|uniref:hypothetical protein n=1 Tax=[Flexibacter] sp. ATCC 35103 TaxID=1937528 RepID=UPI0009C9E7A8|nr:hypothetical protein [[Flexibacter] sp. ATCC 35103]OMQ12517.1 hypothetical protein BXU01_06470 [[Flexibacter] sp. ATCC 35103]
MKNLFSIGTHTKITTLIYIIVLLSIVFYFLKNFRTIDIQLKSILVLLFCGFLFIIYYGINEDKNVSLLRDNFSLTTGSIEEYFIPKLTGRGAHKKIKYVFKVNNIFMENQYQENYYVDIPDDKPDLALLYLVIYEKTNPKNSFILLNYPVNSSDDLERYKKKFKEKIPEDAIKQN